MPARHVSWTKRGFEAAHPWKLISANKNGYWPEESDSKLIRDLRNTAPLLIDVAGQIQPDDGKILGLFVEFMEKFNPDGHLNDEGPGAEITNQMAIECLRRYQRMAEMMHEEHVIS